jgi:CheY-like chemotaxis protein
MASAGSKPGLKITAAERPNTLGLNHRDLVALLEKIEASEGGKSVARRAFARWPFRHASVKVTMVQPSGGEVVLKLACRNLSRGGCALLHNGYIHTGTPITVSLPRPAGGPKDVAGVVKRCQHRRAVLHEIGVKFDQEVDLHEFLGGGNGVEFFSLENVNPEKLVGNILYLEDCDVDFRIVQHFLRDTQLALNRVKTGAEGLVEAGKGTDLIICDWRLPDMKGTEFIPRLREMKIDVPILLITADPVGLMKEGPWEQPNTSLLTKPLQQNTLLRALAERMLLSSEPTSDEDEKIEATATQLAESMAGQFLTIADQLEKALGANDTLALVDACMQIRGSAPALGLAPLAKAAEGAIAGLTSGDASKGQRSVRDLIAACRRLRTAA